MVKNSSKSNEIQEMRQGKGQGTFQKKSEWSKKGPLYYMDKEEKEKRWKNMRTRRKRLDVEYELAVEKIKRFINRSNDKYNNKQQKVLNEDFAKPLGILLCEDKNVYDIVTK